MRFIRYYAALLLGVLCLASCQDSMSTCSTDLSGSTSVMIDGSGCQSLQCVGAQLDCNQNATDGCETNVLGDVNNCGSCGYKCATPAVGEATCENGVCGVTTCSARYKDCNGNTADSCETDTNRDANNCGGCGNVCGGGANAVGVCVQGKCQLSCQGLYLDCDGDAANGCEVNGASDLANCGNCGNACTKVGATTPACSAGSCTSTVCTGAYRTCKAGPVNGCETDTAASVGNCGTCGKVCGAVANGVAGCAASNCGIASCNANFDNCDGAVANGCEVNITTNAAHCGGCGKACPAYANGAAQCKASVCSLGTCNTGFANCDMNDTNGCEINTNTDVKNCGVCGKTCAANELCISGVCSANCRVVGGIRWCYNPNKCGEACATLCASLGLPFTIDDATWFAAQDTTAECQALSTAFGLGGAISISSYTYACLEDNGNSPLNGLAGPLYCSSYSGCPAQHRTNMDGLGSVCGSGGRRSICPCQ